MSIITTTANYMDGDKVLECFIAYDDTIEGQRPAVLVSHAWAGRDEFAETKAKKLAELGYLGFALDVYGKGVLGSGPDENGELMQPFLDDRAMLQKRIVAGFNAARTLPWTDDTKMAAIGFCFGGMCVMDLARSGVDIKGVVSFHGLMIPPDINSGAEIQAKVLMLHGYDDPMVSTEQIITVQEELSDAGVDWQLHSYGLTTHAFTNPNANDPDFGTVYQPVSDQRSWLAMRNFLNELFD